jgi:microcystin-dependent protein
MVNAVAGSITETLPAPTHAGSRIKVTKTDNSTNAVFITTANSSVIYGPGLGNSFAAQSTMTLFGQGASMEFFSDGTNWHTTGTAIRRVGCIDMYGGSTAPPGALLCNYAAISRTTYADLFAVIGTTYGYGDNSTTFNVPDFRSVSPIGAGTGTHTGTTARTLGAFVGAETHTITAAELPPHTHTNPNPQYMVGSAATSTIYTNQGANIDHSPAYNLSATPSTGTTTTAQTVATPTVTPTLVVNFIIWAQ